MSTKSDMNQIIEKLQSKKKETERFITKYQTRKMDALEEYYKGANWVLDFTIKLLKESNQPH